MTQFFERVQQGAFPLLLSALCFMLAGAPLAAGEGASSSDIDAKYRSYRSYSPGSYSPHISPSAGELPGPTGPTGPAYTDPSTSRYSTVTNTPIANGGFFPFESAFSPDEGFVYNAGTFTALVAGRYEIAVGVSSANMVSVPITVRRTRSAVVTTLAVIATTEYTNPLIQTPFDADLLAGDIITVVNTSTSAVNLHTDASGVRSTLIQINRISD